MHTRALLDNLTALAKAEDEYINLRNGPEDSN